MASSYRERVYLGIDEEGNEIIKWASGDSKREIHDSIVRLYVKYGKIDRFLAEVAQIELVVLVCFEYIQKAQAAFIYMFICPAGHIRPLPTLQHILRIVDADMSFHIDVSA